jgi:hypothetical protein
VTLIAAGIIGLYIFEKLQPQVLAEIIKNLTSALLVVATTAIITITIIIWAIYNSNP